MAESHHLVCRKGVWYYRRRVPEHLIEVIGKTVIQHSLDTKIFKQAKRLREVKDVEWSARFAAAETGRDQTSSPEDVPTERSQRALPDSQLAQLVFDYVGRMDARYQTRAVNDPPDSEEQRREMEADIDVSRQMLQSRDDPRGDEQVYSAGQRILEAAGIAREELGPQWRSFDELVRRGLLELEQRRLARLTDDHHHSYFDRMFDGARPPAVTFGELARQSLQLAEEEAAANETSRKWLDKQRATLAVICEIVGPDTAVGSIDYDACLRVRSTLAHVPANRSKLYKGLSLDDAIARAEIEGKARLSSTTQQFYLGIFKEVLDLATRKRLIATNPAGGLRPLKKDDVASGDKRDPFTPEQIVQIFGSEFYMQCAGSGAVPYLFDTKGGWRFWLPLICLFTGMRPNEVCQLHTEDVRSTTKGTWYFDVTTTTTTDEGDDKALSRKTLKTTASKRRVPIHPELMKIDLLSYVADRKAAKEPNLFSSTPDRYGNRASYPLRRFRDNFLPQAITMKPSQSFYSFRHNFRDALRRIGAPADALQALGGWSQGRLVSDDYGDKANPDYQVQFINAVAYAGLDLSHLYLGQ